MASRPRCAHCGKAFTPNYRNQGKLANRQRVCQECGALVGHRLAGRRYRASLAALERKPVRTGRVDSDRGRPAPRAEVEPREESGGWASTPGPAPEILRQVRGHLAAIAVLVGGSQGA